MLCSRENSFTSEQIHPLQSREQHPQFLHRLTLCCQENNFADLCGQANNILTSFADSSSAVKRTTSSLPSQIHPLRSRESSGLLVWPVCAGLKEFVSERMHLRDLQSLANSVGVTNSVAVGDSRKRLNALQVHDLR